MITIDQYFGTFTSLKTDAFIQNANLLLNRVNVLLDDAQKYGVILKSAPATGNLIEGPLGGIRPQNCKEGSALSAHKQAMAIDIYDPQNALDGWLDDIKLLKYNLYREHPDSTIHWCHLTTRAPGSGRRTFRPS